MSSAKEDILARIRSSLADAPVAPEPVRNYRRVSELNENISEIIAERLGEKSTYVVPEGLNMEWLPADTADRKRVTDSGSTLKPGCLSLKELDAVDAVVTGSTVSCAETGTIFLNTNPDEGRRAITLVPDHHICVVPRSTVVELVPESIERIPPRDHDFRSVGNQ